MSDNETTRLKLWRIGQTDKAMQFLTMPPDPVPTTPQERAVAKVLNYLHREVWIPRSLIHHVSTLPCKPGEPQPCVVDVELWFAEKESL